MLTAGVSEVIAPKLVVVDGENNGWRQLVLPLTYIDPLLEDAVICASVSYLSTKDFNDAQRHAAYRKVIRGLRQRSTNMDRNTLERQCVILTLLVLLATLLVNGWPDFRLVLASLESFIQANQFEEELAVGDIGNFLVAQVEK